MLKDGEEGTKIASGLEQVELGKDSYGDPIVSCVVVPDDLMARVLAKPTNQIVSPAMAKLSAKTRLGLDHLRACINEAGREAPVSTNIPAGTRGVTLDEWGDRLSKAAIINDKGNPREEFKRIRLGLQKAELIGVWNEFAWLT